MTNKTVETSKACLELYAVTLKWPQDDEGTYGENVYATDHWDACLKVAESMGQQRDQGSINTYETEAEKQSWIFDRANDSIECHLVKDSLASDLAALFASDLFPDGVKRSINMTALQKLVVEHRDSLVSSEEPAAPAAPATETLIFHSVDGGNCRLYYTRSNGALCCYQLDTRTTFKLFHCSRDGEPEHEIDHMNKAIVLPDPGCSLVRSFHAWWGQQPIQPAG